MSAKRQIDTEFAMLIRENRASKQYSQRKLASEAGISNSNVARIESGYTIPKDDDVIRRLARALDIPEIELLEAAVDARSYREDIQNIYPASYYLFQEMLDVMSDDAQNKTIDFFERRILLFNENRKELAKNFISYFLGNLCLHEYPANGLRPLGHYFSPWCPEIEEWDTANHEVESNGLVKEKCATYNVSPFTQAQKDFIEKLVESKIEENVRAK